MVTVLADQYSLLTTHLCQSKYSVESSCIFLFLSSLSFFSIFLFNLIIPNHPHINSWCHIKSIQIHPHCFPYYSYTFGAFGTVKQLQQISALFAILTIFWLYISQIIPNLISLSLFNVITLLFFHHGC